MLYDVSIPYSSMHSVIEKKQRRQQLAALSVHRVKTGQKLRGFTEKRAAELALEQLPEELRKHCVVGQYTYLI